MLDKKQAPRPLTLNSISVSKYFLISSFFIQYHSTYKLKEQDKPKFSYLLVVLLFHSKSLKNFGTILCSLYLLRHRNNTLVHH